MACALERVTISSAINLLEANLELVNDGEWRGQIGECQIHEGNKSIIMAYWCAEEDHLALEEVGGITPSKGQEISA